MLGMIRQKDRKHPSVVWETVMVEAILMVNNKEIRTSVNNIASKMENKSETETTLGTV